MHDLTLSVCCEFRDPTIRHSQSGWLNNLLHNLGISLQTLFSHQQIPSEQEQFDFNPCFLMFRSTLGWFLFWVQYNCLFRRHLIGSVLHGAKPTVKYIFVTSCSGYIMYSRSPWFGDHYKFTLALKEFFFFSYCGHAVAAKTRTPRRVGSTRGKMRPCNACSRHLWGRRRRKKSSFYA